MTPRVFLQAVRASRIRVGWGVGEFRHVDIPALHAIFQLGLRRSLEDQDPRKSTSSTALPCLSRAKVGTQLQMEPTMTRRTASASVKAAADRAEARARGEAIAQPKVPIDPTIPSKEERDAKTGHFLPGNRFWEARSSAGPKPKFAKAEDLWNACCEYFEWVDANPLFADQLVTFQGNAKHEPVAKMRAMTLAGLCLFIDVTMTTWRSWKSSRDDLRATIERAEAVIFAQKFAGAAADLLNANIIARDLGLAEKSELTGKDGGPVAFEDASDIEKARRIAFALGKAYRRLPDTARDEADSSKDQVH